MKNFKLGNAYGSIIKEEYEVKSWKDVKHIAKRVNETTGEEVEISLSSYSRMFQETDKMKLNSGRDAETIYLSCDLNFVMDLMVNDIVKSDVKKVIIKKANYEEESIFTPPYEINYVLKKNPNKIVSYTFHTDNKTLIERFAEKVSVQALPCGKIDAPSNKKLVKLNRKALKQINNF